ncbi:hypothetical protein [Formosa algae]|uniref:Right handed beta helix domain-containing protein n=1 Tax=Formosa algae TaxID=225843 RepID=A0A9X1CB87_9FLAO|nr:hypothetical protein [Formosa algae]MBP1839792.1 hypothetical protein [Formosa algae]MDQ0335391.1 hypothetical protein [Formosa algae]OEI79218.1 hypothetical protein AST99_15455 [Formosa algae]
MKRIFYFISCCLFLTLWSSCRKDFDFSPSNGTLTFSKDTVYLDTVFSNIGSSTYNLKVYNNSDNDIVIPSLKLALGEDSEYRLNVDGMAGKVFEDVEILAKDSMYIFIETTIDYNDFSNLENTYLYTDKIEFDSGTNAQEVDLVTLVKDAVFIYPSKDDEGIVETLTLDINGEQVETTIQGRFLTEDELHFTNTKPYVIYGYAAVPNDKIMTVDAGARLHFHSDSGLFVSQGASLQVNGAYSSDRENLENEVVFEGNRLEPSFSDIPGQWGTIWLYDGSINNSLNYATIKNATVALLSEGNPNDNKLTLKNTQIYNSSNYGVLGRNTSITAENIVINNSGQSSFAGTLGGRYNVTHATIANYWSSSFRQYPALLINNYLIDDDDTAYLADLSEANFNNCIIYGNDNPEFVLDEIEDDAVGFNFKFTNCLARFQVSSSNSYTGVNYDFDDTTHYENMIFNEDPDFKDSANNELIIGEDSNAINQGNSIYANQVPVDLLNTNRTNAPDLGAYQHTIFEEE